VGVGFVEPNARQMQLVQFADSESLSGLECVLLQLAPRELLVAAGVEENDLNNIKAVSENFSSSNRRLKLINVAVGRAMWSVGEFWSQEELVLRRAVVCPGHGTAAEEAARTLGQRGRAAAAQAHHGHSGAQRLHHLLRGPDTFSLTGHCP
jgi:hypothetical protein